MKDFHIHLKKGVTDYDVMKQYIDRCIELGIDEVIFLDHGNRTSPNHKPVLNNKKIIKEFLKLRARSEYKNITIHSGIETDYFPDKEKQDNEIELMNSGFDYVVSSVHGVKYLNLDDTGYYKAMLDTVKKYPLNILAHLKLYDDYKEHDKIINQILKECKKKNVMMEINTSDRSNTNFRFIGSINGQDFNVGATYDIDSKDDEPNTYSFILDKKISDRFSIQLVVYVGVSEAPIYEINRYFDSYGNGSYKYNKRGFLDDTLDIILQFHNQPYELFKKIIKEDKAGKIAVKKAV